MLNVFVLISFLAVASSCSLLMMHPEIIEEAAVVGEEIVEDIEKFEQTKK